MVAGNETLEALRHRQKLEARAAEEEDLMVRVPLSKEQRKKLKAERRGNLSGAAMMNDFADDVADLVGVRCLPSPGAWDQCKVKDAMGCVRGRGFWTQAGGGGGLGE